MRKSERSFQLKQPHGSTFLKFLTVNLAPFENNDNILASGLVRHWREGCIQFKEAKLISITPYNSLTSCVLKTPLTINKRGLRSTNLLILVCWSSRYCQVSILTIWMESLLYKGPQTTQKRLGSGYSADKLIWPPFSLPSPFWITHSSHREKSVLSLTTIWSCSGPPLYVHGWKYHQKHCEAMIERLNGVQQPLWRLAKTN